MIGKIKELLKAAPESMIQKRLLEHQRDLIIAKQNRAFAASVVNYHEAAILELQKLAASTALQEKN